MLNSATFCSPESAFYQYQSKMENQLCQVCLSLAAGFHHGAYVCEACKKFFKRYSTKSLNSTVICNNKCDLEKIGRRKCSYCRYQKCLTVGMKFSGLRSAEMNIDISQIPCRVCGGKSSGFHFGSLTCEGCKGFFRRAEPMKDKLECVTGKFKCNVDSTQKMPCKSCRFQRCIEVGMSKIGSRIGRQPNAVKYHCALEIFSNQYSIESTNPSSLLLNDELRNKFMAHLDDVSEAFLIKAAEAIDMLQTPIKETEKYTHINLIPVSSDQSLLEVWNSMMIHFDVHTRILIYFAKILPGFHQLVLMDKRSLVQDAMYSIMLLNLAKTYQYGKEESFNYFDFTKEEYAIILTHFPQMNCILRHVMEISRLIYQLQINNIQIGFLCLIELCKNYQNLSAMEIVKIMHRKVVRLFWISILVDLDNETPADVTPLSKMSLLLISMQCPDDLAANISARVPKQLEDHWCHKFDIIFNVMREKLQKYNVEHQSIISQLKKNQPELPYPELYTEMFQLST